MNVKKYRVLCWQPSDSRIEDEVFVDIAPEDGVIHNMIFYSRMKLFRVSYPDKKIVNRAGSVFLSVVDDNEPEIVFEQATDISKDRLIPLILKTFKKMKEQNTESTLGFTISAWEAEKMAEEFLSQDYKDDVERFTEKERRHRSAFVEKHYPQSIQEEQILNKENDFAQVFARREIAMSEQAARDAIQNPIERMKEKMQRYSGD